MEELYSSHLGAEGITVEEYAEEACLTYSTARNRLEKMVKQGLLKKKICDVFREARYNSDLFYNGYSRYMACYQLIESKEH